MLDMSNLIIILLKNTSQVLAKMHQNTNLDYNRKTMKSRLQLAKKATKNTTDSPTHVDPTKPNVAAAADAPPATRMQSEKVELNTIETACRIHEDLCDACYITEEYFSIVMLTIVTIGFLIIVFNAYYVLEVLFRHGGQVDTDTISFIVFLVYQMFIHGLGLFCIVQNSSAVLGENERCSIHVHKLLNRVTSKAARQKLLEFSLQLLSRNVKFTAVNMFPLDRTLIFTVRGLRELDKSITNIFMQNGFPTQIVGAATTYLIILVQFSIQFR